MSNKKNIEIVGSGGGKGGLHYVYKTTNIINGKWYIGVHSSDSLDDDYLGSGNVIKAAIKKYGKSNFKREVIFIAESREDALEFENLVVDEYFCARKDTYNITVGGGSPPSCKGKKMPRTAEHQEKITKALKGRKAPNKGKKLSQELIDNLKTFKGEKHHGFGKNRPEHSEFMNNYWNDEKRLAMSLKMKERVLPRTPCEYCGKSLLPQHIKRHTDACERIINAK